MGFRLTFAKRMGVGKVSFEPSSQVVTIRLRCIIVSVVGLLRALVMCGEPGRVRGELAPLYQLYH